MNQLSESKEFDCLKNGINPTKIDEIKRLLENAESNCTGEMVNRILKKKNMCDLFRESADIVKSNRKSTLRVFRKPNDKPWFVAQCETARGNNFLAIRINRYLTDKPNRNRIESESGKESKGDINISVVGTGNVCYGNWGSKWNSVA